MFKALIIDDEANGRTSLRGKLEFYCPDISDIDEAADLDQAISSMARQKPDVVFLDIKLGKESGFELLEKLDNALVRELEIIFTTAHDEYALKAIKFSALDYLLKPIDLDELITAVEKLKEKRKSSPGIEQNLKVLLENFKQKQDLPRKIAVSGSDGISILKIDDIIRLESSSNYTTFILKDGTKMLVSKTLKEFESVLSDHNFERVHKSHLVNLNLIKRYIPTDGGFVILEDGTKLPVANRKKEELLKKFKGY
jgi:two-component system LytT family response regulator